METNLTAGAAAPVPRRPWRRQPGARLGRRRTAVGWLLAVLGPPLLTAMLLQQREVLGLPTDLMFFFTLVVTTALVGGLYPSLACALLASSHLNYFFTRPTGGLTIADTENALALVIFTLVAAAVAWIVGVAERRSGEARAATGEAALLADLARAVLRGRDTPQALVEELAERFDAPGTRLYARAEDGAPWELVAADLGAPDDDGRDLDPTPPATAAVVGDVAIDLPGRALDDRDRRVLGAFAGQVSLVLARERLRERAVRAQELEQGNAIRTALLTAASHDLRTPLAATRAAVDGLSAGEALLDPEDRAVLVETIDRSTSRLERLIDNLLDLSLLHTGAVRPDLRAVSLEEVVPLAVEGLEPAPVLDLPEDLPLVLTDPGLLERVVANLVANAVRFAPAGVPVQVVARAAGAAVEIRVVDTGPGVAPEERELMFAPFRRLADDVDRGPTGGPAGMGLGLAVARGLAEAVGAGLAVEDTPGGGLTMVVTVGLAGEGP